MYRTVKMVSARVINRFINTISHHLHHHHHHQPHLAAAAAAEVAVRVTVTVTVTVVRDSCEAYIIAIDFVSLWLLTTD